MTKRKVNASATRAFFVHTITKDISLVDCILDLIDNSIDAAASSQNKGPVMLGAGPNLKKFRIEISLSENEFSITDNCGGISLDNAIEYAFTFGGQHHDASGDFSIGVYGIGMKRAIFKLGNRIDVKSTHKRGKKVTSYVVPINVRDWLKETDPNAPWDFDLDDSDDLDSPGTEIKVTDLNEDVAAEFRNPSFLTDIRKIISRDYTLHFDRGLEISLNKKRIEGWDVDLLASEEFQPMRQAFNDSVDKDVHVEVIAGMLAPPTDAAAEPEAVARSKNERRSGWYIACNGRIVLAADKSDVSGWGTDNWPRWHPQYSGFLGLVLFSSEDTLKLPLTTTKRSINRSAPLFKRTQAKLREASKKWIRYTNERKTAQNEARQKEKATKARKIEDIPSQTSIKLPSLTSDPKTQVANISYVVPREEARALARGFGNGRMSYKDIGLKSFRYSYTDFVDED